MDASLLATLRATCFADLNTAPFFQGAGDAAGLKVYLNAPANPAFYAWRTNVTRAEIYHKTSAEGTTWNWTTYKNQSVTEQGAWTQMFMGDVADFSLDNLRAGVDAIFSGAGAPATQRVHVAASAKRMALRAEKMLANTAGGNGALATPAKFVFQGSVSDQEAAALIYKDDGTIWTP